MVVSDAVSLRPRILAVDDTEANLIALRRLLTNLPAEIHTASSGRETLARVAEDEYALILLDVQMPDMDGYAVAEALRANKKTKDIPIIMLTAHVGDKKHAARGYEAGVVDYLPKPLDENMLRSKVQIFLELYKNKMHLQALSKQYEYILNYAAEGILGLDVDGAVVFANPAADKLLGKSAVGRSISQILVTNPTSAGRVDWKGTDVYFECSKKRPFHSDRYLFRRMDGRYFPVGLTASAASDKGDSSIAVVIVFQDVTPRRRTQDQLSHMARYDLLTGLANRYLFQENLTHAIARARRHGQSMALMFIDMDHFKTINDTLGHPVGDNLLRAVAQRLVQSVRTTDTVARIGGDEFTVILEDLPQINDIYQVAEKILGLMEQPFKLGLQEIFATCSIGIAVFPGCGDSPETLTKHADTAMYRAKEQGRNKYCIFNAEMGEKISTRIRLERDLRLALEQEEFELYYQPRVSLKSGKILGLEALLRWNHPKLGQILPAQFLIVAEETGLMLAIDDWVVISACEQLQRWNAQNLSPGLVISVNLSSRRISNANFPNLVKSTLEHCHLQSGQLEVELTESCIMREPDRVIASLRALGELNVRISLDNFGTGYFSVGQLSKLPISNVKIDKSLVQGVSENSNGANVVRAMICMARTLNINTVAEGIETEDQFNFLLANDCLFGQGYYFNHPLPADKVPSLFAPTSVDHFSHV